LKGVRCLTLPSLQEGSLRLYYLVGSVLIVVAGS